MATIMRVGGGAGGGKEPSILPKGYTQLKYIESTGTQYIDTGFNPNSNTGVVMVAWHEDYAVSGTSFYFGCADSSKMIGLGDDSSGNNLIKYFYASNSSNNWTVSNGIKRTIRVDGASVTIDDVTKTYSATSFSVSQPMYLFGWNNKGSVADTAEMKLYSCQIYDNDTLVRDFVPCVNPNGFIGLYDVVNKVFYENAGTGYFLEGPIVSEELIVGTLETGDIIRITENGIPTEYYIAKHGYEPTLNNNRTLLVRKEAHSSRVANSSGINTYADSTIDTWLNSDFFNSLSSGVRELLDATKFPYTPGYNNNTVTTLERAVFLLSLTEVGGTHGGANVEGSALPIASVLRIAYLNGTAVRQFTRSPYKDTSFKYFMVMTTAGESNVALVTESCGIRPVFTIPSDAKVVGPDNIGRYTLEVDYVPDVYGIARDITASSPEWVRTDGAMTFSATASIGTVAGASDFDNIYPWSEMKRVTLDSGDVMVRIPKFYYGRYRNGNIERIQISGRADVGLTLHPAFNHGGVEQECIYVGAYKTSAGHKSVSGVAPLANLTRAQFRNNAQAKGSGWSLIDISTLSAIQMLYLVEFANNNSQAMIGRGYVDGNTAKINTGSCDAVIGLTGRPVGTDGKVDIVYRGIEGIWGNVWEFVDGFAAGGVSYHVTNDPSLYDGDISAYPKLSYTCAAWSSAYISAMGFDEANPHIMLPTAASGGSESTCFCDTTSCVASGWRVTLIGGHWSVGGRAGIFANALSELTTYASSDTGSRLIYIP